MAEVVLLPLVPVTPITRRRSTPSSPESEAASHRDARGHERLDLGPVPAPRRGSWTTTSQRPKAASPPRSVLASTGSPSTDSPDGRSSTSTGSTPRARSRRRLAPLLHPEPRRGPRAPPGQVGPGEGAVLSGAPPTAAGRASGR